MTTKEEILAGLIQEHKVLTEMAQAVANSTSQKDEKSESCYERKSQGHEYAYLESRGGEIEPSLETVCEVEVSSSSSIENNILSNTKETPTVNLPRSLLKPFDADHELRMEQKRQTAKLQEKLMNQEYQKAIGYLLCPTKSKSGKQKKKQTMTAYLFFCRRYRSKIVSCNPNMNFAQISKLLSRMWHNASEQEKNICRLKLEQHRSKINAIVQKNMIEKMKLFKEKKLKEAINTRNEEIRNMVVVFDGRVPSSDIPDNVQR